MGLLQRLDRPDHTVGVEGQRPEQAASVAGAGGLIHAPRQRFKCAKRGLPAAIRDGIGIMIGTLDGKFGVGHAVAER
ncbi:hypothetical protein Cmtc_01620 [Cupriavidus sp. TKC]|nr:hypothetical protein Cmtc_01620 [Cupriavidus sp. TKC]